MAHSRMRMEEWRQIGGGLQNREKMRMRTWQEIPRCSLPFSPRIIWISATRPGCPTARFARPGRGPAAIRRFSLYEEMAGIGMSS